MEITVYRDAPLASEVRSLPAATYNLTRTLLSRTVGALFVPLRSMQFLAIVDQEEILFVDHLFKELAVAAWQNFNPGARESLHDPVTFDALYYREDAQVSMGRLQGEFLKALQQLERRNAPAGEARVLKFERMS
ncbi:MAG: hypothetical protein HKL98_10370 [Burkholderiales bacterium]|nr:hypothetical protein [Burkholderiales bacterium]